MPEEIDFDRLGPSEARAVFFGDVRYRERNHAEVKWRASGDPEQKDVRVFTGYASVFNQPTTLFENKRVVVREQVAPGFFDGVLDDDCSLNYVHDSASAMCRNNPHMPADKQGGPGSMELTTDAHGLRVFARIPMNDIDAQRLAPKMDNGVVDQMSWAWKPGDETCDESYDEQGRTVLDYTLTRCGGMIDVAVCPRGAYSQTDAMLRSLCASPGRSIEGREDTPVRSEEGQEPEPRADAGASSESIAHQRSVAHIRATVAMSPFKPRKEH